MYRWWVCDIVSWWTPYQLQSRKHETSGHILYIYMCIHTITTLHPGLRLINWAYNPGMIPPFLDTLQTKQNALSNLIQAQIGRRDPHEHPRAKGRSPLSYRRRQWMVPAARGSGPSVGTPGSLHPGESLPRKGSRRTGSVQRGGHGVPCWTGSCPRWQNQKLLACEEARLDFLVLFQCFSSHTLENCAYKWPLSVQCRPTTTIVAEGPTLPMLHDADLLFLFFPLGYICLDTERGEWDNRLVRNRGSVWSRVVLGCKDRLYHVEVALDIDDVYKVRD